MNCYNELLAKKRDIVFIYIFKIYFYKIEKNIAKEIFI